MDDYNLGVWFCSARWSEKEGFSAAIIIVTVGTHIEPSSGCIQKNGSLQGAGR